ncbi:MAG: hypothetical protein ACREP9_09500, partial [Candidatus Dormibacteraceae bacterium]
FLHGCDSNLRPLDPQSVFDGTAPTVTCRAAFEPVPRRMRRSGGVAVRFCCQREPSLVSPGWTVCRSVRVVFHLAGLPKMIRAVQHRCGTFLYGCYTVASRVDHGSANAKPNRMPSPVRGLLSQGCHAKVLFVYDAVEANF